VGCHLQKFFNSKFLQKSFQPKIKNSKIQKLQFSSFNFQFSIFFKIFSTRNFTVAKLSKLSKLSKVAKVAKVAKLSKPRASHLFVITNSPALVGHWLLVIGYWLLVLSPLLHHLSTQTLRTQHPGPYSYLRYPGFPGFPGFPGRSLQLSEPKPKEPKPTLSSTALPHKRNPIEFPLYRLLPTSRSRLLDPIPSEPCFPHVPLASCLLPLASWLLATDTHVLRDLTSLFTSLFTFLFTCSVPYSLCVLLRTSPYFFPLLLSFFPSFLRSSSEPQPLKASPLARFPPSRSERVLRTSFPLHFEVNLFRRLELQAPSSNQSNCDTFNPPTRPTHPTFPLFHF
jgi:hypothetical protein